MERVRIQPTLRKKRMAMSSVLKQGKQSYLTRIVKALALRTSGAKHPSYTIRRVHFSTLFVVGVQPWSFSMKAAE